MFLRRLLNHAMINQDVKRIQKTVIEKSISSIWRKSLPKADCKAKCGTCNQEKCRINSSKFNLKDLSFRNPCLIDENFNNSNYNYHSSFSDSSFGENSSTHILCSCANCSSCECNQNKIDDSCSSSKSSSLHESSKINNFTQSTFGQEEESINLNKQDYYSIIKKKYKDESIFKKICFYIKKKKIQPILYFFVHLFLLFVSILLKYLCHVNYGFFKYKFKSVLRTLLMSVIITVTSYKLSNFIDYDFFCNLSNAVNRILYSKNDAFSKIIQSDGK